MATVHVLLVYNLEEGRLVSLEEFSDGNKAMTRYAQVERNHLRDPSVEIVLVAADSLETIRHTHASYFSESMTIEEIARDLLV